jgi:hypothetical protein
MQYLRITIKSIVTTVKSIVMSIKTIVITIYQLDNEAELSMSE